MRRSASYGIIRREFDHYLLERAAAGADVRWGIHIKQVNAGPGGVGVETEHGVFEAPVVIGAGGHRCPVAKALGMVSERESVVVAQESETRLSPEWAEAARCAASSPGRQQGRAVYRKRGDALGGNYSRARWVRTDPILALRPARRASASG